jgi:hypothetical protein
MLGSIDEANFSESSDPTDRFSISTQKWQLGWAIFVMNMFQLLYVALVIITDILIRLDSQKFFSFVFFFCGSSVKSDYFEDTVLNRKHERQRREHLEMVEKQRFFVNNIVPKTFEQVNEEAAAAAANVSRLQFFDLSLRHGEAFNGNGKRHKATPSQVSGVSRVSNYTPSPTIQLVSVSEDIETNPPVEELINDHPSIVSSESAAVVDSSTDTETIRNEPVAELPKKRKSRWD